MLYQMVEEVCALINNMVVETEAPMFAAQLRKMRPTLESELMEQGVEEDQLEAIIQVISTLQLQIIKGIPAIAAEMSELLQSGLGDPGYRCAVATSLVYLVQPRDMIDDNLPGGYGFIDDAILLHEAAALSWEISGDMERAEETRKLFQYSYHLIPERLSAEFKNAVSGLAMTINFMCSMDPGLAEMTTQMLISNPAQPISPQGGIGAVAPSAFGSQFADYANAPMPRYTWDSGDSMGVNFPGGGGVATDGRDIFTF